MHNKKRKLPFFLFIILMLSTAYVLADIDESLRIAKLDENLTDLLENGDPEEEIIVHLEIKTESNEYAEEIIKETRSITEEIMNKSNEIKQIYREIDDELGYNFDIVAENFRENNETFIQQYQAKYQEIVSRNDYDEIIKETLVEIEELRDAKREKITNILKDAFYPSQEEVIQRISSLSDTELVLRHIAMNAITLKTKTKHTLDIANIDEISNLYRSEVGSLELDISRSAMGANQWHNQGYEGGLYDVLIIDTGMDMSHPALTNVDRKQKTLGYPGQYCSSQTDYDDFNGHGTHVAGIIKAQQGLTSYKGIAPSLSGDIFNGKLCRGAGTYFEDVQEGINWAVINGVSNEFADVISLSSGWTADEVFQPKYADAVVYNYDTNWVKSAGNSGPTSSSITSPGDAYNVIAVGNINDNNTLTRTDDTLDNSSSRGPVGGSRIKPDIVAPGMYIVSTNYNWEAQSEYVSKSGTSMSAPHVAGAVLLLYNYGIVNALEQRALLLNSATDCELNDPQGGNCPGDDGPDNNYGFGYIDMVETWTHKDDVASAFISPGGDEMYKLTSQDGGDKVTLIWNRFVNNVNATSVDILNLKFYGYDEYDGSLIDSDTTGTDVRRQLQMPGGGVSTLIVRLTADSGYSGPSSEEYAIAHQGGGTITQIAEPTMSSSFTTTTSFDCQNQFTVKARATNNGPIKIHNVEALLNVPPGLTLISGNNPQTLGTINAPPSTNYADATWILQASSPNEKTLYANVTSASYGIVLESLATQSINVTGVCGNIPPVVQFVQVTPAQPLSTDTLDCAFNVSDDANFTFYSYNLSWYKNEARQTENNEIGSFTPGTVVIAMKLEM